MRPRWNRILNGMALGVILRQLNAMYGPWVNEPVLWALLDVAVVVSIVLGVMAICSGLYHLWRGTSARRPVAHRAFKSLDAGRHWRGPVHQCRPDLSLLGSGMSPRHP